MQTLAVSKNYKVINEYEVVFLSSADWNDHIIGDFYGDPEGAIIDWDERWIISFGHGLIIYKLEEPFTPFQYDNKCNQWIELFREPEVEKTKEIIELVQIVKNKIRFCTDLLDDPMVYDLDINTLELTEVFERK